MPGLKARARAMKRKSYEIPTVVELNTVRLGGQRCLQLRPEWSHADDGDFVKRVPLLAQQTKTITKTNTKTMTMTKTNT